MRIYISIFTTLLLLSSAIGHANVVGVGAQNFNSTTDGLDYVTVHSSKTLAPGVFNLGLYLNYAVNTLPYFDDTNGGRTKLDDSLTGSDLNFGVGLLKNLDFGVSFPSIVAQSVKTTDAVHGEFSKTGSTEVRLNTKYRLLGDDSRGLATIASVNFNRVDNDPYAGDASRPTYNLEMAADTKISRYSMAVNVGHRWRQPGSQLAGSPIEPLRNQWIASLATSYLLEQADTKLIGEIFAGFPAQSGSSFANRSLTSVELLLGAKHDLTTQLALHAGAGTGLVKGVSSPDWRVYGGINYAFGPLWGDSSRKVEHVVPVPAPAPAPVQTIAEPPTIPESDHFVVGQILFQFNSAILVPNHAEMLADLVSYLKTHPYRELHVEGHTDSVGPAEYNKRLSQRRAQAVVDYLGGAAGLPKEKLKAFGYGSERPIADNGNYQGRDKNRRVEFQIIR